MELVGVYDLRHLCGCACGLRVGLPALYIRLMREVEEHEGHYLASAAGGASRRIGFEASLRVRLRQLLVELVGV